MESFVSTTPLVLGSNLLLHHLLSYESRNQPLLGRRAFMGRMAASCCAAAVLIGASLLTGMVGYRLTEGMEWIDAFENAAMILSGMGSAAKLVTVPGKVFVAAYALYSGLALVLAIGLIIAPVVHRLMHRFHLEAERE